MTAIDLPALDGANPLCFLAALGALRLLDAARPGEVRLSWALRGGWVPRLHLNPRAWAPPEVLAPPSAGRSAEEATLLRALAGLLAARRGDPALGLGWDEVDEGKTRRKRAMRAPPDAWRAWAEAVLLEGDRLAVDLAAATTAEVQRDNGGKLKPSVFEFQAGQQMFFVTAEELVEQVHLADLEEALFGPWTRTRTLKVMSWDATDTRDYALRAGNPAKDKKTGVPGADALGLWGLSLLPVMPAARENATTAAGGAWKSEWMRWPLWRDPLPVDVVRSLLATPDLPRLGPERARARGIVARFEAKIGRSDQGGYGSFSPPEVLGG